MSGYGNPDCGGRCPDIEEYQCCKGDQGPVGPMGHQGPEGHTGPQGCPGADGQPGATGAKGDIGCTGPQGIQGIQGEQGLKGETGPQGKTGPEGPQGLRGLQGNRGEQGLKGDTGATGNTGAPGAKGDTGSQGPRGETGPQGPQGFKGDTGLTGAKGDIGPQGIQGLQGLKGDTGAQGPQGLKGDTGAQGIQGLKGDTGAQGIQGLKGDTGAQGLPGVNGTNGQDGAQGPSGIISCTFDEPTNCYDVAAQLSDGSTKNLQLGGCITLLACGYAGDPICATNVTGTITPDGANNRFDIDLDYTVAGATLTGSWTLFDTIQSGTTNVSNLRFENGSVCVDITTTGKLDSKLLYDKALMPKTPEGCTAPLSGVASIDGLVLGGGQATQINKSTGQTVTTTGFEDLTNGNYNVTSDSNSWVDVVDPNLFGGIPGSDLGAMFSQIVDTFGDNTQTYTYCESVCYYQPIEYETDGGGNPLPGTGVDANGNPFTGQVTDLLTGATVTLT